MRIARVGLCLAVLAFLSFVGAGAVQATTYNLGGGSRPVATVDVPDGWDVSDTDHGIEAALSNGDSMIWFNLATPQSLDGLMQEYQTYFSGQNVQLLGSQTRNAERNGWRIREIENNATWQGNRTILNFLLIDAGLSSGQIMMIVYWATPESDQANREQVNSMISSIRFNNR